MWEDKTLLVTMGASGKQMITWDATNGEPVVKGETVAAKVIKQEGGYVLEVQGEGSYKVSPK